MQTTSGLFRCNNYCLFIYLLAILFLILRTIRQTGPVIRLIRNSKIVSIRHRKADTHRQVSCFVFIFFRLYLSILQFLTLKLIEIMNHEREHIRQQHWIDLLLYEITRTTQWFNPVIWLIWTNDQAKTTNIWPTSMRCSTLQIRPFTVPPYLTSCSNVR